jgi:hypothetical protein
MKIREVKKLLEWAIQYSHLDYVRDVDDECDLEALGYAHQRFIIERSLGSRKVREKRVYIDKKDAFKTCENCLLPDDEHYCSCTKDCLPEHKFWMKGYVTSEELEETNDKSERVHTEKSEKAGNRLGVEQRRQENTVSNERGIYVPERISQGDHSKGDEKESASNRVKRDSNVND